VVISMLIRRAGGL